MAAAQSIVNRLAAAITGAAIVGLIVGLGAFTATAVSCAHACPESQDALQQAGIYLLSWAIIAAIFGTIPCFVILAVTRAKARPWRALLALVPAAAIGFFAVVAFANTFYPNATLNLAWLGATIVLPSLAGYAAGQWLIRD